MCYHIVVRPVSVLPPCMIRAVLASRDVHSIPVPPAREYGAAVRHVYVLCPDTLRSVLAVDIAYYRAHGVLSMPAPPHRGTHVRGTVPRSGVSYYVEVRGSVVVHSLVASGHCATVCCSRGTSRQVRWMAVYPHHSWCVGGLASSYVTPLSNT